MIRERFLKELQSLEIGLFWELSFLSPSLCYLHYKQPSKFKKVPLLYLSAGIHGDEPAGPRAILQFLQRPDLWHDLEIYIFPILNPTGFTLGKRENRDGVDLNRDYRMPQTSEVKLHRAFLDAMPELSAAVCLHEDWEASGCYLYHLTDGTDMELGSRVLEAMSRILPVELSALIDGQEAAKGLIQRHENMMDIEDWPEAIYLARSLTKCCFTLETPSSFPLEKREACLLAGMEEVAHYLRKLAPRE